MALLDRALALIGLRRIKHDVKVSIVGNADDYLMIANAVDRAIRETRRRHGQ